MLLPSPTKELNRPMTPALLTRQLHFGYRAGHPVLHDVSFTVDGGFSVILGANGAGKSTLMRLLAGEERPPKGTVFIHGSPTHTSRLGIHPWRQHLGWVPQHNPADPAQRVTDFVTDVGWLRGLSHRDARRAAKEAIARVKLEDKATSRIRTLSGGMQRQAMIAAGIVHNPSIVLLDEPTAGLDPNHRADVTAILRRLANNGTSILMSTHVAADVTDAQRVLVLDSGAIVADSPVDSLISQHGSVDAAFRATTGHGDHR